MKQLAQLLVYFINEKLRSFAGSILNNNKYYDEANYTGILRLLSAIDLV